MLNSVRSLREGDGFRARDLARGLLGPEGNDPAFWPKRVFALGIEQSQDADHVLPGLPEGGNAAVPVHRLLAGIVSG